MRLFIALLFSLVFVAPANGLAEEPVSSPSAPETVEDAVDAAARAAAPAATAPEEEAEEDPTVRGSEAFADHVRRQASLEVQLGLRLFEEFDDYRAITALKRYAILENTPDARFLSDLMIGQIYHRNAKPQLSALAFERATEAATDPEKKSFAYLLGVQELCLPLSYYIACRSRLQEFGQSALPPLARDIVDYQVLYTDVVLRSEYVSEQRAELFDDPKLRQKAMELVAADRAFEELDLKSPLLAGILSGVIPGAGQAYNGRWADGVISLLFVSLFGAATYYSFAELDSVPLGIFSGFLAVGFYSGGIYNAVSDANRINAERYLDFFENLKRLWPRVTFAISGQNVVFGYAFDWPGPTLESRTREALEAEESGVEAPDTEE